jgi:hypothetical protein
MRPGSARYGAIYFLGSFINYSGTGSLVPTVHIIAFHVDVSHRSHRLALSLSQSRGRARKAVTRKPPSFPPLTLRISF